MGAPRGTHSKQRVLRGDAGVMVWCYALPEFLAFSCELLPDFECEVWIRVRVVVVIGQRVKDWCFSDRHLGLLLRVEQCKRYATGDKFRERRLRRRPRVRVRSCLRQNLGWAFLQLFQNIIEQYPGHDFNYCLYIRPVSASAF